jgi:hypothetical protein
MDMNKDEVYEKLSELGLERIEYTERAMYKLVIVDEASNLTYPLILTTHSCEQGDTIVKFEEADFQGGESIPRSIRNAALTKLFELEQLFYQNSHSKELSETTNGSMAPTEKEMKKLGDDMKKMKTNKELMEQDLVPDPMQ